MLSNATIVVYCCFVWDLVVKAMQQNAVSAALRTMNSLLHRFQPQRRQQTLIVRFLVCILSCVVVHSDSSDSGSAQSRYLRESLAHDGAGSSTIPRELHIFDRDGRQQVISTSAYPYNAVGLLRWNDDITCTATLVASNIILTAAECVLNSDGELLASSEPSSVFSLPQNSELKTVSITRVYKQSDFWTKWTQNTYVLVELDQDLGTTSGVLYLPALNVFAQDDAMNVQLVGYGSNGEAGEYYQTCKVHFPAEFNGPDFLLHHDCDVSAKRSPGSPMLIRSTDLNTYIIGIHTNAIGDDPEEIEVTKMYPSYNDSVANRGVLGSFVQPHLLFLLNEENISSTSSAASNSLEETQAPVNMSFSSSGSTFEVGSASNSLSSRNYDGQTDESTASSSDESSLAAPQLGIAATAAYSCIGLVCASWLVIIFIAVRRLRANQ